MNQRAIPCTIMRGGTSKGLYFPASSLPSDVALRDRVLLAAMGSPDVRQIDGLGGGHPLTSKAALVGPPSRTDADIDYLFLQIVVDKAEVSDGQNCGNLLAGVAQFAVDSDLVSAVDPTTSVRIHMVNSGSIAVAHIETPAGEPNYDGDTSIDGVPGAAAPVRLDFEGVAGANCGALLPTGAAKDVIDGIEVTCIDNGMPVVLLRATDLGKSGLESPAELENDKPLKVKLERIRLEAGPRMNLGDVGMSTVPKMCLISEGGPDAAIVTRTFIPHRVHEAIGVLGAASVAAACVLPGTVADKLARVDRASTAAMNIAHPTGHLAVGIEVAGTPGAPEIVRTTLIRTARKLMSGQVFIPAHIWPGETAH